ncbi:MAG: hypothetical protein V2A78_01735 [bacterium]
MLLLAFLFLIFSSGCGSPPQDIGGGQSSQNTEGLPAPEAPAALADSPPASQQELISPEVASSLPEDGAQEDIFAIYGDGKLIAAWSTDAEGNNYPISKERAEKLIPSDFVEKMKSCKNFDIPQLYRKPAVPGVNNERLLMDSSNSVAYKTDEHVLYGIKFSNIPNPCPVSTPFVFALGWVSPDPSENTITKYAPVPPCATGGMIKYTSGGSYQDWETLWCNFERDSSIWDAGGVLPSLDAPPNYWLRDVSFYSQRSVKNLSLGKWQIPAYFGETGVFSSFCVRQLTIENFSAEQAPSGGYIIKGDVVFLSDRPQPSAVLNWTVTIRDTNWAVVYTEKGTRDKIEVAWDGNVVVASEGKSPEQMKALALYSYDVLVVADKTYFRASGPLWGNPKIEVWTNDYPSPSAKRIATSDNKVDQKTLLNQVFLPAKPGNDVMVVVKDPPASGSSNYIVNINSTKTLPDPKKPLPLPLAKDSQTHLYTGSLSLNSTLIADQPPHPQYSQPSQTTFTSVDTTERADSDAFAAKMSSATAFPPYQSPRLEMGRAFKKANPLYPLTYGNIKIDVIEPSLSAVQAAGFEEVTVSFPEPYTYIKACFRVKNEADVFYYSGHASYSWNYLEIYDHKVYGLNYKDNPCPGSDSAPQTSRPVNLTSTEWVGNLKTVIFACCAVLDINDYNGSANIEHPGLSSYAPGKEWDKLGSGSRILLGYNWYSPLGPTLDKKIINKYFEYLPVFTMRNSQPVAWLRANGDLAGKYPPENFPDNACAIDNEAYCFIKYERSDRRGRSPSDPEFDPKREVHKYRILYRLPRNYSGTTSFGKKVSWNNWEVSWESIPDEIKRKFVIGRLPDKE